MLFLPAGSHISPSLMNVIDLFSVIVESKSVRGERLNTNQATLISEQHNIAANMKRAFKSID